MCSLEALYLCCDISLTQKVKDMYTRKIKGKPAGSDPDLEVGTLPSQIPPSTSVPDPDLENENKFRIRIRILLRIRILPQMYTVICADLMGF